MSHNLSLYAWRDDLVKLDMALSLVDEINLALEKRCKIQKYIYSSYVDVDKLYLQGGIKITFEAKEMEFKLLSEISEIAKKYDLGIYENTHEYKSHYEVTIVFRTLEEIERREQKEAYT
tara:strand:- start:21 stop:377 length:357 start_codon:yes stop_codon:yes gene_type:complete